MQEMIQQWAQQIDESVFHFINSSCANSAFDTFMPWITDLHHSASGIAFLLILAGVLVFYSRGLAVRALMLSAAAMGLSDFLSHYIVKEFFQRPRPTALPGAVLRTFAHVGYSFPSNHAANNMALAVMMSFFIPKLRPVFLAWAILIGFSRVYVGVHYPFDVLGGFTLGAICALIVYHGWDLVREYYFKMPKRRSKKL